MATVSADNDRATLILMVAVVLCWIAINAVVEPVFFADHPVWQWIHEHTFLPSFGGSFGRHVIAIFVMPLVGFPIGLASGVTLAWVTMISDAASVHLPVRFLIVTAAALVLPALAVQWMLGGVLFWAFPFWVVVGLGGAGAMLGMAQASTMSSRNPIIALKIKGRKDGDC